MDEIIAMEKKTMDKIIAIEERSGWHDLHDEKNKTKSSSKDVNPGQERRNYALGLSLKRESSSVRDPVAACKDRMIRLR